ncbi:MAG: hypothetical protein HOO06_12005 [Bdellovibrionaceae bacterium]|jgi:hypothetical protein|nr:hypothetical protein [Pseudobdellovibrionaceae bacterium]
MKQIVTILMVFSSLNLFAAKVQLVQCKPTVDSESKAYVTGVIVDLRSGRFNSDDLSQVSGVFNANVVGEAGEQLVTIFSAPAVATKEVSYTIRFASEDLGALFLDSNDEPSSYYSKNEVMAKLDCNTNQVKLSGKQAHLMFKALERSIGSVDHGGSTGYRNTLIRYNLDMATVCVERSFDDRKSYSCMIKSRDSSKDHITLR